MRKIIVPDPAEDPEQALDPYQAPDLAPDLESAPKGPGSSDLFMKITIPNPKS
jgi:hypothetical protein